MLARSDRKSSGCLAAPHHAMSAGGARCSTGGRSPGWLPFGGDQLQGKRLDRRSVSLSTARWPHEASARGEFFKMALARRLRLPLPAREA